jgi:hypothetical protein
MRDMTVELKALRLHGMASAWGDLAEQGAASGLDASRWLVEHLQAETTDRSMRSVQHQMSSARFPVHRNLAGFDFDASVIDQKLVHQLAMLEFTEGRAQRGLGRWSGHRQDPSGNGSGRVGHHAPQQARAVLLDGRSVQCTGAGGGPGQGRTYRAEPAANGCW